jgi:hypothetical protein
MATLAKYYIIVRPGGYVGPHKLDSLREWVDRGIISPNWMVCCDGDEAWIRIADIPKFYIFPTKLRERLTRYQNREIEHWWADPVTEKQLKKLDYFEIPFSKDGLTKGRASELIDAFVAIDANREEEYQKQPANSEQIKKIRSLGGRPRNLTHLEANELIEELSLEQADRDSEKTEAEDTLEYLDLKLNHEDVLEICKYKCLNKSQLKYMLNYFTEHVPDWRDKSGYDLGGFIRIALPGQMRV